jgi:hypothetical protein
LNGTILGGNVPGGQDLLCVLQINQTFFLLVEAVEGSEEITKGMGILFLNLKRLFGRNYR